jgi:hypothetical protein
MDTNTPYSRSDMMRVIRLTFERGGTLEVELDRESAPETCRIVLGAAPWEAEVLHSRWSGREVNFSIPCHKDVPPPENQTCYTSEGAVVYWREWDLPAGESPEVIAVYYGPELARDHYRSLKVNVFGRVFPGHQEKVKEIGERVWCFGKENVKVEVLSEIQSTLILSGEEEPS